MAQHLSEALKIVRILSEAGFIAYFAGGWVRDYIMGHPSDDIDIATNATPDQIIGLFPNTLLVGLAFGIVIVVVGGHQFEVATFRKDLAYLDGRRPIEIAHASPEEDASRRDFTINGMFYDPLNEKVLDFVGGRADIHKQIIRTIGDPQQRFLEDRLRMIRAFRFSARFGFTVDSETATAIRENAPLLFPAVAPERIWHEFHKMSRRPRFHEALSEMHRLELLPIIFPEMHGTHLHDLRTRIACFAFYPPNTPLIFFLGRLFESLSLPQLLDIVVRLRGSKEEIKRMEYFVRFHHEWEKLLLGHMDRFTWVQLLAHPDADCLSLVHGCFLNEDEQQMWESHYTQMKTELEPHIERVRTKQPLLSGARLKVEGIAPGKHMGALLKRGEELAILHDIQSADLLISFLKKDPVWLENQGT